MENLYDRIEWLKQSENSSKLLEKWLLEISGSIILCIGTIQLPTSLKNDEFILANLDVSGFYRVNYDTANWNKIIQQLNNKKEVI